MRRSVRVVTLAELSGTLAVAFLSGCSSPSPTAADVSKAALAPAAAKPTAAAAAPSAAISSPPITDPRPFPQVNVVTAPAAVLDALTNKRAMFLVYYDPVQSVTADQKKVVAALSTKFKGLIDFIAYDLPKTNVGNTDAEKKAAARVAQLGQLLKVGYMPAILLVTRDGTITWQSTGYQDIGPLEREILRATR